MSSEASHETVDLDITKYDNSNVFAKILKKELPAKVVLDNDCLLAFDTIEPDAKIHVLIIPKGEYIDYQDFVNKASEKEIVSFFRGVTEVAKKLNIEDSYKLITNYGKKSGQAVFHFHMHMLRN